MECQGINCHEYLLDLENDKKPMMEHVEIVCSLFGIVNNVIYFESANKEDGDSSVSDTSSDADTMDSNMTSESDDLSSDDTAGEGSN